MNGSVIGIGLLLVHVLLIGGVAYTLIELRKSTRAEPELKADATAETEAPLR